MHSTLTRVILVSLSLAAIHCSTPSTQTDADVSDASPAADVDDASDSSDDAGPPPEVMLPEGAIRGARGNGYLEFFDIPYAAPPVGPLRWRPPQAPAHWTGTRDGTIRTPKCAQNLAGAIGGQEDCLYVNVHTPDPMPHNAPVMVWIHGGAFVLGEGLSTAGDTRGDVLAATRGVVVVSMNYRLGPLGFMSHAALTAEQGGHSGNYGLMDQQFAMQWVRDHIASFGGDPNNITLFGESAGAMSVCAHMAAPGSDGLFHRAIAESGPCGHHVSTLAESEAQGQRVATAVNCATATDVLACLRAVPPAQLINALPTPPGFISNDPMYGRWFPTVDGSFFPTAPLDRIRAGMVSHVPLVFGWNRDEGTLFVFLADQLGLTAAQYPGAIDALQLGDATVRDRILAQYPLSAYPSPWRAYAAVLTDYGLICPARRTLTAMAPHLPHVWNYVFTYANAGFLLTFPESMGAFHSAEVQFVFGHPARLGRSRFIGDEVTLNTTMMDYWTRFATTSDPNGGTSPIWPEYDAANERDLQIDVMPVTGAHAAMDACAFWEGLGVYP